MDTGSCLKSVIPEERSDESAGGGWGWAHLSPDTPDVNALVPGGRGGGGGLPQAGHQRADLLSLAYWRWKKKFPGMGVAEVRRPRVLEEGNRKLKQLVADLSLDKQLPQDVLRKKP